MRTSDAYGINHSKRTGNAQTAAYFNLDNVMCVRVFKMHRVGYWRREVVKQKRTHRPVSGGKETTLPSVLLLWATSYFVFFSPCVDSMTACCGHWWRWWETSKKVPTCPFNKGKSWWRVNGTIGGSRVMRPEEELSQDFCKNDFLKSSGEEKKLSAQMRIQSCSKWSECRSEDIATLPLFYVFMAAIKPACLDREITPCLPTNKPPALLSGPLFIIHNLLWCQGQSDSIVMVKGISADPELSTGMGNPGIPTNKKEKPLKSDGLDCNQRSAKDLQGWKKWQCSQQSACRHFGTHYHTNT